MLKNAIECINKIIIIRQLCLRCRRQAVFFVLNIQCKCNDKIMTQRSGKMVFTKTSKYQEER